MPTTDVQTQIKLAEVSTEVKHLRETIDELKGQLGDLSKTVADLTAALNRGKGAIALAMFSSAGLGSLLGWAFNTFILRQ